MANASPIEKAYTLTVEDRGLYLYVQIGAEGRETQAAGCFWNEVGERIGAHRRLLAKYDPPLPFRFLDAFEQITALRELGLGEVKVAIVDPCEENHDTHRFAEQVAGNRGLNVKFFSNTADAEKWLLRGSQESTAVS